MITASFPAQLGVWGETLRKGHFAGNAVNLPISTSYAIDGGIDWEPQPWSDSERIRWSNSQRTIQIRPDALRRYWEIVAIDSLVHGVGVLENIGLAAQVLALDGGIPVESWNLDGTDPNLELIHPDPGKGILVLGSRLTARDITRQNGGLLQNGVTMLVGDVIPSSQTIRFGWNQQFSVGSQMIFPDATRLSLWVEAQAAVSNAWQVRITGLLAGYSQTRGGRDSAGVSARRRS